MCVLRWGLAAALGVLAVALLFRPLLSVNPEQFLWADDFDSRLLRWTAEWGYFALGRKFSWSLFWNAQSFYPHANTLAYSDCLLTLQLFYSPLRWLGIQPLSALYLSLASVSVGCFLLTVRFLGTLGVFGFAECLLIALAAHFGLSLTGFLSHYQLFGFQFAPPFLIALYLFTLRFEYRWFFVSTALFILGVSFAIYLAPILFALSLMILVCTLPQICLRQRLGWIFRRTCCLAGLGAVIAAVFYFAVISHYVEMVRSTPPQTFEESAIYSASPSSLLAGRNMNSLWYAPAGGNYAQYGDWERAYFPGWLLLFGGAAGAATLLQRSAGESDRKRKQLCLVFGVLASAALVLSWGPFVEGVKAPFYYLSYILPGLRSVRAPGRFGFILGLPLGILMAAALRRIIARRPQLVTAAALILGAGMLAESLTNFRLYPYHEEFVDRAAAMRRYAGPRKAVAELPAHGTDHFETIRITLAQLNRALYHRGRLLLGYGGRSTAECQTLIALSQRLSAGAPGAFADVLQYLAKLDVSALLVHLDLYSPAVRRSMTADVISAAGFRQAVVKDNYIIMVRRRRTTAGAGSCA